MAQAEWSDLGREFIKGGLVASALLAGTVIAGACTQIDAATKLASYYQRYTEMRDQIQSFDSLRREVMANLDNILPNLQARLDMMEDMVVSDLTRQLEDLAADYGIDVTKAAAISSSGDLIKYAGRNLLGDNDPCFEAALGLGRDVPPTERIVTECAGYLEERSVTLDYGSGGVGPNAGIQLGGMLASATGDWPILNLYREDLAWVGDQLVAGRPPGEIATKAAERVGTSGPEIATAVSDAIRLGGLIVGQGGTSVSTLDAHGSPSRQTIAQSDRLAQAGRNAYAIEAVAREAATLPRIQILREQLDQIDIENLDQMTEGQRHAARLAAQAATQELRTLLHASRLRHEQLEGVLLAIDTAQAQHRLAMESPL